VLRVRQYTVRLYRLDAAHQSQASHGILSSPSRHRRQCIGLLSHESSVTTYPSQRAHILTAHQATSFYREEPASPILNHALRRALCANHHSGTPNSNRATTHPTAKGPQSLPMSSIQCDPERQSPKIVTGGRPHTITLPTPLAIAKVLALVLLLLSTSLSPHAWSWPTSQTALPARHRRAIMDHGQTMQGLGGAGGMEMRVIK
jgi:hypothetical protein